MPKRVESTVNRYKRALDVSIVQMDSKLHDVEYNVDFVCQTIKDHSGANSLVVFPELALTGYSIGEKFAECALRTDSELFLKVVKATRNASACVGFIEETDSFSFFNSLAIIHNQEVKSIHRKVYLPNYGIFEERKYFKPGTSYETVMLDNFRLAPFISGDAWSPAFVHLVAADLASVIIFSVCSPEAGLGSRISSSENWKRLVRMYATLYGCYVVFVNRVGQENNLKFWGESEVIDPFGQLLVNFDDDSVGVKTAEMSLEEVRESRTLIHTLRDEDFNFLSRCLDKVMKLRFFQNVVRP